MIKKIDIGHEHVLAFRVEGELDEHDMKESQRVIKPRLESGAPFSLYIEMAASEGVQPAAIVERLRFIFSNFEEVLKKVGKVAIVTDKSWLQHLATGAFALVPPIEQRSFTFEEAETARKWVSV